MDFDDQDGAVADDEAGAIIEVDLVAAQQVGHGLEGAGLVGHLDGQRLDQGDHDSFILEGADGGVALVHEEPHHAKAAAVGNGQPGEVDPGLGEQPGDPGGLARFVFHKDG